MREGTTRRWILWGAVLLMVTVVLVLVRDETEQAYIPLPFLLVVLGGSIHDWLRAGGRRCPLPW